MAVTQKEIAQRIGVSQQLVASALNGNGRVGEEMRRRVLAEAERLGYRPNQAARALATRRTHLVALWLPQIISPYCAHIAQELMHLARASDYELLTLCDDRGTDTELSRALKWPVDGVIVLRSNTSLLQRLEEETGCRAIVSIGAHPSIKAEGRDSVYVELLPAAHAALDALLAGGSRRVALMGVPGLMEVGEARYDAYRETMKQAKQKPEYVKVAPHERQREAAHRALLEYVKQHGCPDGLFCGNDEEATGAYRALRELGLRIPDDVAIVGCNGIEDAIDLTPTLSTLALPVEEMCALAWQQVRKRIENPEIAPQNAELQARFLQRGSLRTAIEHQSSSSV